MQKRFTALVIDAQGGGIGRQLVSGIKHALPDAYVLAVGTNTSATSAMLKAGADEAATGENSVLVACRKADVIVGPLGIVVADSMLGEITPIMASAVAQASAQRVLIPFSFCDTHIVGASGANTTQLVGEAIRMVALIAQGA